MSAEGENTEEEVILADPPVSALLGKSHDDDIHLDYTQGIRRRIIEHAVTRLKDLDPKEQNVLLKALSDHDKVVISVKRMKVEEQVDQTARNALATFHSLVEKVGGADPLKVDPARVSEAEQNAGPRGYDPSQLPEFEGEITEDNCRTGIDSTNFDAFMAGAEQRRQKQRESRED